VADRLKFTVLGCGSSPGVPRIHGDWGACDPANPKNQRLRCSLLVERFGENGVTRVVVDTSPDFRQQMLSANVTALNSVLYTHPHADHVHGIDDLRGFALAQRQRIPVYADEQTMERLMQGFGYCFQQPQGSMYPPILDAISLKSDEPQELHGAGGIIHVLPIRQIHGPIDSLGFRFSLDRNFTSGGLCYSPDVSELPPQALHQLRDLEVWIVDALQYRPHVSHFSVGETLQHIERLKPARSILTHMHIPLDYETLKAELPITVEPAFDGMEIEL